jgi:DnaJ-domain-containing protein 1
MRSVKWRRSKVDDNSDRKSDEGTKNRPMDPSNIEKYDCYSILGITHNANDDEIKRAYRRLALQYHPDRNKSTEAAAIFTVVQIAYDTLTDSGKRRRYDATIPALGSSQQTTIKVLLEGAYTEGDVMDDHAVISIKDTDEAIIFENSVKVPTIWINNSCRETLIFLAIRTLSQAKHNHLT